MDYFRAKRYLDALPDWEVGRPQLGPVEEYLPRMRALLKCLGEPQTRFRSVIVGGTNGKGTVSSLLAELLQEGGHRVGLYTSPHLHTQRERIRVEGQLLDKDCWAEAVEYLDDRSRDFASAGLGPFSKFEALTGLAAWFFAEREVEFGIFEVGLGGRYDATNAWDSELSILTRIGLDHMELLGETLGEIAADKVHIARPGRPLISTEAQEPGVLEYIARTCTEKGVLFESVGAEWMLDELRGRPATYGENARLALAAARSLAAGPADEVVVRVVEAHRWPGRFEVAQDAPLVLLDGAHNPASAQALASELEHLGSEWVLVLGVGVGHDGAGILRALAPVARRIVLTASDHPRALDPAALAALAMELDVECISASAAAFRRGLELAGREGRVCVAGSLHLVALAREFFDLPLERDGITEDMALENLECLAEAGRRQGLNCEWISADGTRLKLSGGQRPFRFWRNKHPFNDYVEARLAEDKAYQYEDFTAAGLPMPRTSKLFNPLADSRFDRYKTHLSVEAIVADLRAEFEFPLVLKKSRSSLAQGVFLVRDVAALARRLEEIFTHSAYLDNIVLVQQFVAGPEYRIIASRDQLLLAYGKESGPASSDGDLNPLHQAEGRAVRVDNEALLQSMQTLTEQVAAVYTLGFYAIDLIDGADGFSILELNPNPMCSIYNRDNGRGDFIRLYERLLAEFVR